MRSVTVCASRWQEPVGAGTTETAPAFHKLVPGDSRRRSEAPIACNKALSFMRVSSRARVAATSSLHGGAKLRALRARKKPVKAMVLAKREREPIRKNTQAGRLRRLLKFTRSSKRQPLHGRKNDLNGRRRKKRPIGGWHLSRRRDKNPFTESALCESKAFSRGLRRVSVLARAVLAPKINGAPKVSVRQALKQFVSLHLRFDQPQHRWRRGKARSARDGRYGARRGPQRNQRLE